MENLTKDLLLNLADEQLNTIIYDYLDEDDLKNIKTITELEELLRDIIIDYAYEYELIYNSECFEYIINHNIVDFSEAISEGNQDLFGIANYYRRENKIEELGTELDDLISQLAELEE